MQEILTVQMKNGTTLSFKFDWRLQSRPFHMVGGKRTVQINEWIQSWKMVLQTKLLLISSLVVETFFYAIGFLKLGYFGFVIKRNKWKDFQSIWLNLSAILYAELYIRKYIYIYICVCVCVCVCMYACM